MGPAAPTARLELFRMAQALQLPPAELSFLASVPAEVLCRARQRLASVLREGNERELPVLVRVARLTPNSLGGRLVDEWLGPLVSARVAERLESGEIAGFLSGTSNNFVVQVLRCMTPEGAKAAAEVLPVDRVQYAVQALVAAGEYVLVGPLLAALPAEVRHGEVAAMVGEALLGVGLLTESTEVLTAITAVMGQDELNRALAATKIGGDEDQCEDVIRRICASDRATRVTLLGCLASQGTEFRAAMVATVIGLGVWEELLPSMMALHPSALARLLNVPPMSDEAALVGLMAAGAQVRRAGVQWALESVLDDDRLSVWVRASAQG